MAIQPKTNYFSGFQEVRNFSKNDLLTNALAILKIFSYFTIIIPLAVGISYGIAALKGRIKHPYNTSQSMNVQTIADQALTEGSAQIVREIGPLTFQAQAVRELETWAKAEKASGVNSHKVDKAVLRITECLYQQTSTLDLSRLGLKTFFQPIENFSWLVDLKLSYNQLKEFSLSERALPKLNELYLNNNQLEKFSLGEGALPKLNELYLNNNQLEKFSLGEGALPKLNRLYLFKNQLKEFSLDEGTLPKLNELYLDNNQLKAFPLSEGELPKLERLDLSDNKLTEFSLDEGALPELRTLRLKNNQLTEFTLVEVSLPCLSSLDVRYNPNLSTLPMALQNCPRMLWIDTSQTNIPDEVIQALQTAWEAKRRDEAVNSLPVKLNVWRSYAKQQLTINLEDFDDRSQGTLYEWLTRLEQTAAFSRAQQSLAKVVCHILRDLKFEQVEDGRRPDSFTNSILTFLDANNEACGDRAAMSLNMVYGSWMAEKRLATDTEKLNLLVGLAKTEALNDAIEKQLNVFKQSHPPGADLKPLKESVEIHLYCLLQLKDKYHLISAVDQMLFSNMGERLCAEAGITLPQLEEEIEANYRDVLLQMSTMDNLLKQDSAYQQELGKLKTQATHAMGELDDQRGSLTDQVFKQKMDEITATLKAQEKQLFEQWLATHN